MKALLAVAASVAIATPAAAAPCLSQREAETIALVALPDLILETGRVCSGVLPATSLMRRTTGAFIAKYQAAADAAWPEARASIAKLSDPSVMMLLQSDLARPAITAVVVPMLVGRVALSDCGTLDRLATLLEPLPPRNTAGVVVTALRFLKQEKAKGNATVSAIPDLPVCVK